MKIFEFDAILIKHPSLNSAYIEFPYDARQEFGTNGQVKVVAEFDGQEYKGSLANMGGGCHILGLTQQVRRATGKEPGDIVHVALRKDDGPRIVEIPEDLAAALAAEPEARAFLESLSYTNRKEYAVWITEARRPETRARRVRQAVELLRSGRTRR